jgi:hypothetical protein
LGGAADVLRGIIGVFGATIDRDDFKKDVIFVWDLLREETTFWYLIRQKHKFRMDYNKNR